MRDGERGEREREGAREKERETQSKTRLLR